MLATPEGLAARPNHPIDIDPSETSEWRDSLEAVIKHAGPERARFLLDTLQSIASQSGVKPAGGVTTPYVNTIRPDDQANFPGNRDLERKIKSAVRWNAMAMVQRANSLGRGTGGHIATFASAATLYEIGQNHFFHGPTADHPGDVVFYQGHASPGMYSRAFLEGRLTETHLDHFRLELAEGGGLSSYPHPWLMPEFWQYPTVSMGLGPIMSIYHARFNRYLRDRSLSNLAEKARVWAFLGDGECDEPESLGCITLAARERLDNLTWVINCNLQRLDGPVRGNGKIIQELEGLFRGAGWNVLKVIWSTPWDELLQQDYTGALQRRMMEVVDGEYQEYIYHGPDFFREKFFNTPELKAMVSHLTDDQLYQLKRGGHDPLKVYAAYKAATEHKGQPTVILVKTVKGYGIPGAEATNTSHQQKELVDRKLAKADGGIGGLRKFRDKFGLPFTDDQLKDVPFFKPDANSPEMKYLFERRQSLGGFHPTRNSKLKPCTPPDRNSFVSLYREMNFSPPPSTTKNWVSLMTQLLRDPNIGDLLVPIVPDEGQTFGMPGMYKSFGVYSSVGQTYIPVDKGGAFEYREATDGQILQEGINEAGSMASWIAAGTAYSTHGVNTIPFYIYYSMFGFQRVGDLAWAAADARCRGFLLGATAGRTTLNGEGLQHEDGHSPIVAATIPTCRAYDPAFAYELAIIIEEGINAMFVRDEECFYYLTLYNEAYAMPAMPGEHVRDGVIKGIYPYKTVKPEGAKLEVQLLGSGVILMEVLKAQQMLAEKYGIASTVYSVTSYPQLRRDAIDCERSNRLHPDQPGKFPYVQKVLGNTKGPIVASSDYMRSLSEMVGPYLDGRLLALGTDGFGRSETRKNLRRFFEVDAESVTIAALYALADRGEYDRAAVAKAIKDLGVDPNRPAPWTV